ncbi:WD repeat-containing protein 49-like [Bubalus kerabau]|uniref:WD repeat-containing protein 49-like n=1 Tax=Bubalus carabanensis TaxID=3119969 RepID=UPI00244EECBB|nr:WD repeat-containing protein 49-like [Bubalus carabanensis]
MGTTNVKQKMKEIKGVGENVKARKDQAFLGLPQRRAECDQMVFCIHKGVKAFTFCKGKNLLLTGGMDRIIRIWNPHLPGKPTGMLRSHTAPVIYIHVSAEDNKILSMSTDNTIKIWDLETNSCLFTASSKASGIRGEPGACLCLPGPRALYVAAGILALLHLRLSSPHEPHPVVSHKEPVVGCQYNPTFRQVVSCSEASVVKVWDFETGRLLSEFTGAHGNAAITCLTFDSSGRRLVSGGRDSCLKIRSDSSGHCLHTLKHGENQGEVCDCTYLEVNQNKCIRAVGWERRIDVYFDTLCDFHHFRKPQPHWQDDLNHGHKEGILCVAHCPPSLLATSSYDGGIIIWNVISGHVFCKLNSPSSSDGTEDREGPERSVSCLAFLKTRAANLESASASLMANRPRGSVTFWRLFGEARPIANFAPSRDKALVSSMVVTAGDACAYVADQCGFVHVYDIEEYSLQGQELQPPTNVTFWRAHISMVTFLELIEEEELLLSSSLDRTVRLWSRDGAFIGTFGQSSPWDIFTPASWSHPRVPHEVLTDPQSMPAHPVLEGAVPATCRGEEQDKVVEDCVLEVKEDSCGGDGFGSDRPPLEQSKPPRGTPALGTPSIYQSLQCHQVPCLSALPEKLDLSILGADMFNLDFLTQEKEGSEAAQKAY